MILLPQELSGRETEWKGALYRRGIERWACWFKGVGLEFEPSLLLQQGFRSMSPPHFPAFLPAMIGATMHQGFSTLQKAPSPTVYTPQVEMVR